MQDFDRPSPFDDRDRHAANIALYLILTLVTLGLFNLYWNWRQMAACNEFLERDEFHWGLWLLLSILTCGLYHLYYQYQMGAAIVEIQGAWGAPVSKDLPVLSVVAAVIGFGIVADCIHQHEINKLVA